MKNKKSKNNGLILFFTLFLIVLSVAIVFITNSKKPQSYEKESDNLIETVSTTVTTTTKKETTTKAPIETEKNTTTLKAVDNSPKTIYSGVKYRSKKAKVTSMKYGKELMLLNNYNCLPDDYKWNLVYWNSGKPIGEKELWDIRYKSIRAVDKDAYPHFKEMFAAAEAAGCSLEPVSSYRSIQYQDRLFSRSVDKFIGQGLSREDAIKKENRERTFPGTSEHHTGLCMDILEKGNYNLTVGFSKTPEFKWLSENAEKYGFVLRYPKDKENITEIMYEPWHYRYVGVENAKEMNRLNMCLEEYIDYLDGKK